MADKKISQLSAATTPVAGTEVLPIVQGGATVKVSIDNLTAGKTVKATTFDTDVAAAKVTLTGTTLAASGTDSNINVTITPKGSGSLSTSKLSATGDVSFDGGQFVFNESGADKDFRVEGDTNENLLFVDASTDRIGINTQTPTEKVDIRDPTNTTVKILASDLANGNYSQVIFQTTNNFSGSGIAYVRGISRSPGNSTTDLALGVNPAGGGAPVQAALFPAAGGCVVGTAALATNATDGFLYVPTCAGTPTGTPTTQTGTAPIVVDTTNNKLYFYSGGQWRDAGP